MKAEQILEKHAKMNMIKWNRESFKKTHPQLYKSIIGAIQEAQGLYNEPCESRTPDLLTEVFEGFGRAFGGES